MFGFSGLKALLSQQGRLCRPVQKQLSKQAKHSGAQLGEQPQLPFSAAGDADEPCCCGCLPAEETESGRGEQPPAGEAA